MASPQVTKILKKEMDRKDFLKYSTGVVLAVVGVTGFINTITKLTDSQPESTSTQASNGGYGSSAYGR